MERGSFGMSEVCIDSGMGWNWSAVPAERKDYDKMAAWIITKHFENWTDFEVVMMSEACKFYIKRLQAAWHYGLVPGREIIKAVCRSAAWDHALTLKECTAIINCCHDTVLDDMLMEVNYNEGWS